MTTRVAWRAPAGWEGSFRSVALKRSLVSIFLLLSPHTRGGKAIRDPKGHERENWQNEETKAFGGAVSGPLPSVLLSAGFKGQRLFPATFLAPAWTWEAPEAG